jgi:hypothetical protein
MCRGNYLFSMRYGVKWMKLSALVEWAGRLTAREVFPISGFRPQLAEFESVQLEPGMTDFGRHRVRA